MGGFNRYNCNGGDRPIPVPLPEPIEELALEEAYYPTAYPPYNAAAYDALNNGILDAAQGRYINKAACGKNTGVVLVLFILLVIIVCVFCSKFNQQAD
ncbi:hypothetical protein M3223_10165 [Paenibacillus pasadenensis]|uniref:hypothetical protein n=1 Tax=Paenibacillus pasadenensis TaxID=217090 RepID=UPI00203D0F28|nr:hypothetical protein [Paenibacillus pasadenensis]MCM3747720.1 hypothetical protein [Paenibacillus pasadenensis]